MESVGVEDSRALQRRLLRQRHATHQSQKLLVHLTRLAHFNTLLSILAVVSICGFMYFSFETGAFLSVFSRDSSLDYGIGIDAGSHGSRIHVYSWISRVQDPRYPLSGPMTFPKEIFSASRSPGIGSMADTDPESAGEVCIGPLIEAVKLGLRERKISQKRWGAFPIYLKATAGMRNMDALSRSRIMNSIRRYLANKTLTPFAFHWDWARVIAGEEEGVYGWLTVNNAFGTVLETPDKTIGALDMGGASMQITFFPRHTSIMEDYYGLMLGGKTIRLYSHSYLGYGWEDALTRITTKLSLNRILELAHNSKGERFWLTTALDRLQQKQGLSRSLLNVTSAPPGSPNSLAATAVVNITALHPCYPEGHQFSFDIPSLVYPEGRFYVDLDVETLRGYMTLLGIPGQYQENILSYRQKGGLAYKTTALSSTFSPHGFRVPEEADVRALPSALLQTNQRTSLPNEQPQGFSPLDAPLPMKMAPKLRFIIHFKGSSNAVSCRALAQSLFYDEPCFVHSCSFNGVYQPRLEDSRFIAFDQFSKVQRALNLSQTATPGEFAVAADRVCGKSRDELRREWHDNQTYRPYGKRGMMKLCWKALWAQTMLQSGYGFPSHSRAILYTQQVDNETDDDAPPFGWATGSMIYEVNKFPWTSSTTPFQLPYIFAVIAITLLASLITLLFVQVHGYQKLMHYLGFTTALYCSLASQPQDTQMAYEGTPAGHFGYTRLV